MWRWRSPSPSACRVSPPPATLSIMSASMNLAITIFGFVLSALFLMVICCRLLCSRAQQHGQSREMYQSDSHSLVERSIHGLEPSVVTCFPTIKYNQHVFTSTEDNSCTICLSDYKEREVLRILPGCGHAFHIACIDLWLRQHHTCPVCRISLQVFSEWRHMSGPLISRVAMSRFVPGALPDHLFEQPKKHHFCKPCGILKNSSGGSLVAGESSSLQGSQEFSKNELELGDMQQPLEHIVIVDSDDVGHHERSADLLPGIHDVPLDDFVPDTYTDSIANQGISFVNIKNGQPIKSLND